MAHGDSEKAWRRLLTQIEEALRVVTMPDQRSRLIEIQAEVQGKLTALSEELDISGTD